MVRSVVMDESAVCLPAFDLAYHEHVFSQLLRCLRLSCGANTLARLQKVSEHFLGHGYLAGALGEGVMGKFDQSPVYRSDVFDCVTYVNTVLALFYAYDLSQFKKRIVELGYQNSETNYLKRNHFISVDWNPNNAGKNYIKDITTRICADSGESLAHIAHAVIDRPSWFRHRTLMDLKLIKPINLGGAKNLLAELHQAACQQTVVNSYLPYLPIDGLFNDDGKPKFALFDQLPNMAVVEIVRPNWDLRDQIGTHLNISHMGFLLRLNGELVFRHASTIQKIVIDRPFIEYLYERLHSPTIKGVNIQQIVLDKLPLK